MWTPTGPEAHLVEQRVSGHRQVSEGGAKAVDLVLIGEDPPLQRYLCGVVNPRYSPGSPPPASSEGPSRRPSC